MLLLLLGALWFAGERAGAQTLVLGVSPSASSIQVSNTLTYTISVTNLTGFLVNDVQVTNVFPISVQVVNIPAPSQGFSYSNTNNTDNIITFDLLAMLPAQIVQVTFTIRPTVTGTFTNNVTVVDTSFIYPSASTNVVTQVTNSVAPQADLGVAITVPNTTVYVNDLMSYGISATNSGPNDAPNAFLTNTLPPGVILKSVSPATPGYTTTGSNMIFNLGTLAAGNHQDFRFNIQPTNAGILNFFAAVGSASLVDSNAGNNSATNRFVIANYLSSQLVPSITTTQLYNPQNGLVEQTITVSNAGPSSVPAERVIVTDLTGQMLFNAVGTNNGSPFVVCPSGLTTGQTVNLLLQFSAAKYFPLTNSQLQAYGVQVPNLTPPAVVSSSSLLTISRVMPLSNGTVLLEFPSIIGRTYTVVYSDNVLFSNAMIAPPSITAGANMKQWVDYGPPTTSSLPARTPARFYRVILNP
jgi:uncharacterized repeat protein (TIGR01451 family)